ncbi:hypothetical protein [Planococcus sp. YIM B11945]|uniref:hypothetical protein n=1 Tax=Planococcus sp. YIM B11945 TaxID=3435410 RepID=UPI003D7DF60C
MGEWFYLNEKGISWAETMVSLLMLFILFGSLLPIMQHMHQSLQLKKERVAAYETLHEAAKEIHSEQVRTGARTVNGVVYTWEKTENLCVAYTDYQNAQRDICIK